MVIVRKYSLFSAHGKLRIVTALLAAFMVVCLLPFLSAPGGCSSAQAFAKEGEVYSSDTMSRYGVPLTSVYAVRTTPNVGTLFTHNDSLKRGDVYLVIAEDWTWKEITEERTPTLYSFVYANASANMIYDGAFNWSTHLADPSLHTLALANASVSDVEYVMQRVTNFLKTGDSLILTNSNAFLGEWFADKYDAIIIKDASDKGLFTSSSTRHMGLITTGDAIAAVDALMANSQRFPANLKLYPASDLMPTITRLNILSHDTAIAVALQKSQPAFTAVFVAFLLIALIVSAIMLFLEIRLKPRILNYLLPAARIMWIVVLSIALASYLMMIQLPTVPDAEICLDYFWFCVMEISLVCLVIALVFRWAWAFMALLGATCLTLIIDQLVGGPLSCGSYLSYAAVEGVRFFGIGNEGAAVLFGAWVMLVSFYLTKNPFTKFSQALRRWLYPVASAFVIFVIAAPWFGANFGGIIWGIIGTFVSWRLFNAQRLRKREVFGAIAVAGVTAVITLLLDTKFNTGSHMGGQFDFSQGGILEQVVQIFSNVLKYAWDTIIFSPILAVAFVAILGFLLFLAIKRPGPYRAFWESHSEFYGAFVALLATGFTMFLVEDSGILMPALVLLYPIAGLMWFVCDFHSLHIRDFLRSNSNQER